MDKLTGALALYTLATDDVARARILAADLPRALREEAEAVADRLPPLSESDVKALCNGDHAVSSEIERWRDARWSGCDVSELKGPTDRHGNPSGDVSEAWSILRGSSRFEVREVPRYEPKEHGGAGRTGAWSVWNNETNDIADTSDADSVHGYDFDNGGGYTEGEARNVAAWLISEGFGAEPTVWIVWDTDEDTRAHVGFRCGGIVEEYDPCDESSADDAAAAANVEDYRTNAAGWPWAQNHGWAIDEREADDFAAAGFVVATHEPSGQVYAGIDGGGYSFLDAHWCPLYLRVLLHGRYAPDHIYLPTSGGLRRVVREGAR